MQQSIVSKLFFCRFISIISAPLQMFLFSPKLNIFSSLTEETKTTNHYIRKTEYLLTERKQPNRQKNVSIVGFCRPQQRYICSLICSGYVKTFNNAVVTVSLGTLGYGSVKITFWGHSPRWKSKNE